MGEARALYLFLSFSLDGRPKPLLRWVAKVVSEEGFVLNEAKTRVMRRGAQQRVTGLVVNARPHVARREVDRLEAILTQCVRLGPAGQNRSDRADFRGYLEGRVAFVVRRRAARLRERLKPIDWSGQA